MGKKYLITIDDVIRSGSVVQAVIDEMPDDILIADASARGGQTFATSGPGSGWAREFTAYDYAAAAIKKDVANSGCKPSESRVIDPEDGRMGHGVDDRSGDVEWDDESSVLLFAPTLDEAAVHIDAFEKMWEKRDSYGVENSKAWDQLAEKIKALAAIVDRA